MRKSASSILFERVVKLALALDSYPEIEVYAEMCGRKDDNTVRSVYKELLSSGHPFSVENAAKYSPLPATELAKCLSPKISFDSKSLELLQLADLGLYPLAMRYDQFAHLYPLFLEKGILSDSVTGLTNMVSI